jgi:hypothetical protein
MKKRYERFLSGSSAKLFHTIISSSNHDCTAQKSPRELKLLPLELPGNEDFEYLKFFKHICEQSGNTKRPAAPFTRALGGGDAVGQTGPQR